MLLRRRRPTSGVNFVCRTTVGTGSVGRLTRECALASTIHSWSCGGRVFFASCCENTYYMRCAACPKSIRKFCCTGVDDTLLLIYSLPPGSVSDGSFHRTRTPENFELFGASHVETHALKIVLLLSDTYNGRHFEYRFRRARLGKLVFRLGWLPDVTNIINV